MHWLQLFLLHGSQLQLQFDLTIRISFFKVMDNNLNLFKKGGYVGVVDYN